MKCEKCFKNTATYHGATIINGHASTEHLCTSCAKEFGKISEFKTLNVGEFFGINSVKQNEILKPLIDDKKVKEIICSVCGSNKNSFLNCGFIGCSKCYELFENEILEAIRKTQGGNTIHIGKKI